MMKLRDQDPSCIIGQHVDVLRPAPWVPTPAAVVTWLLLIVTRTHHMCHRNEVRIPSTSHSLNHVLHAITNLDQA